MPAPAEVDALIAPKGSRQMKIGIYEKNPEIFITVLVNTLTLNDISDHTLLLKGLNIECGMQSWEKLKELCVWEVIVKLFIEKTLCNG